MKGRLAADEGYLREHSGCVPSLRKPRGHSADRYPSRPSGSSRSDGGGRSEQAAGEDPRGLEGCQKLRFALRTGHVASPPHGAVDPVPDPPPPPGGRFRLSVGRRGEGRGDCGPAPSGPGSAQTGRTSAKELEPKSSTSSGCRAMTFDGRRGPSCRVKSDRMPYPPDEADTRSAHETIPLTLTPPTK